MTVRRALGVLTLTALAVLGVPAVAAAAPADGTTGGWVRLTHLSPDTPAVDVQLTAASDSGSVLALSDVAYGDVSDYTRVPAGTYTASMVPAGGDAADPPIPTDRSTPTLVPLSNTLLRAGRFNTLLNSIRSERLSPETRVPGSGRSVTWIPHAADIHATNSIASTSTARRPRMRPPAIIGYLPTPGSAPRARCPRIRRHRATACTTRTTHD